MNDYNKRQLEIEIEYHRNEIKRHQLEIDMLEDRLLK